MKDFQSCLSNPDGYNTCTTFHDHFIKLQLDLCEHQNKLIQGVYTCVAINLVSILDVFSGLAQSIVEDRAAVHNLINVKSNLMHHVSLYTNQLSVK